VLGSAGAWNCWRRRFVRLPEGVYEEAPEVGAEEGRQDTTVLFMNVVEGKFSEVHCSNQLLYVAADH
jgi:hypothetical protein